MKKKKKSIIINTQDEKSILHYLYNHINTQNYKRGKREVKASAIWEKPQQRSLSRNVLRLGWISLYLRSPHCS